MCSKLNGLLPYRTSTEYDTGRSKVRYGYGYLENKAVPYSVLDRPALYGLLTVPVMVQSTARVARQYVVDH